ncbi:DUF475 domain-containing protein [Candidatus Nitrosacidococcus sp. I8]|uniref:DUF475 domain-containing protein n=1 Tax=Candidatus Nitrosacidococcus sp. I8 TaxID=2942908 RepID=UPI002227CE6A|nr:DUF475 domain-containing protein [Candidatus Nitrosacidococcus sp. I8]CAH9018091.1 hypothetical protein NURINAE_00720 [Candidatus Nitrosacidococcus sp. I8]
MTFLIQHFKYSLIVTAIGLSAAFLWGGLTGVFVVAILGILEVSLSFDNAVVNASVLKDMHPVWQQRFLTWGILIAVFGMRLLFPIVIVTETSDLGMIEVVKMALGDPDRYSEHLIATHAEISTFGGMFLLMVFLSFLFDEKELYWLGAIEEKLAKIGHIKSNEMLISLGILLIVQHFLPIDHKLSSLLSGVSGIFLFSLIHTASELFTEKEGEVMAYTAKHAGIMGFLYLEVLDASFSFDGVIGAFAITKDIIIIMLGLGIGAMFVRCLTVYLVEQGTLDEYVFLEHGAHYAIGALALIMLMSTQIEVPEVITGLIGATFIGLALFSSIRYKKDLPPQEQEETT